MTPEEIRGQRRVPENGGIFFTIAQTVMSGSGGVPDFGEYAADLFDVLA